MSRSWAVFAVAVSMLALASAADAQIYTVHRSEPYAYTTGPSPIEKKAGTSFTYCGHWHDDNPDPDPTEREMWGRFTELGSTVQNITTATVVRSIGSAFYEVAVPENSFTKHTCTTVASSFQRSIYGSRVGVFVIELYLETGATAYDTLIVAPSSPVSDVTAMSNIQPYTVTISFTGGSASIDTSWITAQLVLGAETVTASAYDRSNQASGSISATFDVTGATPGVWDLSLSVLTNFASYPAYYRTARTTVTSGHITVSAPVVSSPLLGISTAWQERLQSGSARPLGIRADRIPGLH